MNSSRRTAFARLLVAAGLLLPAAVLAQETAGRVLIAVGDVTIERAGRRIPAPAGTEVRAGDQFQLGAQSNAQIRLVDESIIALRPETTFRLTEFAFVAQDESKQRAFFELLKGGVRTVTGVVGRVKRDNYRVTTPTSTIGIRGTHYNLVECQGSCRNRDGTTAPNGTYGGVTDGRIAVTNQSGEAVFGADQYFHVASASASPQPLIAPPGFLRDTLEGRVRAQQKPAAGTPRAPSAQTGQGQQQSGGEQATTVAQTGMGATTGDSGVSGSVTSSAPVVLPPATLLNTFTTNELLTPGGVASTVQSGFSGTIFYRLAGPFNIPSTCTNPPCGTFTAGQIILGVNFALQRAFVKVDIQDATGYLNIGTPGNSDGIPIVVSGGEVTFGATLKRSDYPTQNGAFRCSDCGPGDTVGFLSSIGITGTISGGTASLVLTGSDAGGTGSLSVTLAQTTTPNTDVGAMVVPRQAGGADARSAAYWDITLDASRRVTSFGPPVGAIIAKAGSASNIITGSNAAAGNLVWGHWQGSGAQVRDFNYANFNTGPTASLPWITGTAANTLPTTLGSASYTLVGGLVNGGNGVLNSGSLTADFVNRTMSLTLNATNPGAGNTFNMSGTSGITATNGRFSAGFNSVTCTGSCVGGTPTGSFGGFFAGTQAEGAGVGFTAGFAAGTGVSGVAAFKR